MTEAESRSPSRIPKIVLGLGVIALLFSAAGYFGNFVQWSNAAKTPARILAAEQQWARRGAGNINVGIEYSVEGEQGARNGSVSLSAATLEKARTGDRIDVYYMKEKPDRAIPVLVLEGKQRDVRVVAVAGAILLGLGLLLRLRRRP